MTDPGNRKFDLVVIGSGLAGIAAACFAANRGLTVARVSATGGELGFAGGPLDLLGVYPPEEGRVWEDPWAGIAALTAGSPMHPYARLGLAAIRGAMDEFLAFLQAAGLEYCGFPDRNTVVATAAGTRKVTYRVPRSMWPGAAVLAEQLPALIVDFTGMKDFNAVMVVEGLRGRHPGLRSLRIPFPVGFPGIDRQNLLLAGSFESPEVVSRLADAIRPHLGDARAVGMPAVLGLTTWARTIAALEESLGVEVFEIPTLPPSVPGQRLRDASDAALSKAGVVLLRGRTVKGSRFSGRSCFAVDAGAGGWWDTLETGGVILASGRFIGGGLAADRTGIVETVFGLPVAQPPGRSSWHRESFLDRRGHPVNEAGVEVDERFRPLGRDGKAACKNVFAAGSLLAHQDWMRTKSGAGLAVSTALGAVNAFLESL